MLTDTAVLALATHVRMTSASVTSTVRVSLAELVGSCLMARGALRPLALSTAEVLAKSEINEIDRIGESHLPSAVCNV